MKNKLVLIGGKVLTFQKSIELGLIKKVKANNSFREMVENEVYDIKSFYYSEGSLGCEKGTMLLDISVNGATNISNFEPVI